MGTSYWPLFLIIGSNVCYHLSSRFASRTANPFAALVAAYLVGAAGALALYFATERTGLGSLVAQAKELNGANLLLGLAIVDKADAVCICGDIQSRAMHTFAWINALKKPVVLVPGNHENSECGHIHTGDHTPVRLGSTLCRNVSYLDESYSPAFLPATLAL